MFPIGDDNSTHRTVPLVTFVLAALIVIGLWIVLQFFSGIGSIANSAQTGGVAYMAHIGGFLVGFVLTFLFRGSRGTRATG